MIAFSKYHGAGNDFILIDDLSKIFPEENHDLIRKLCERRFGVGADGLMLLRPSRVFDFSMIYFNADGFEGTMCGNGGRCLVVFARDRGRISGNKDVVFSAVDGKHRARFISETSVSLEMKNVKAIFNKGGGYCVDTGSVHHVEYVDNLVDIDVCRRGRTIRRLPEYGPNGCNVNFIHAEEDGSLSIRTYERGVEDETLACGTGSVAAAIVHHSLGNEKQEYLLRARGGMLKVKFHFTAGRGYHDIWLEGPAIKVFEGEISE